MVERKVKHTKATKEGEVAGRDHQGRCNGANDDVMVKEPSMRVLEKQSKLRPTTWLEEQKTSGSYKSSDKAQSSGNL